MAGIKRDLFSLFRPFHPPPGLPACQKCSFLPPPLPPPPPPSQNIKHSLQILESMLGVKKMPSVQIVEDQVSQQIYVARSL